jgi:transcriptional regulator with XRE-family HTH domain
MTEREPHSSPPPGTRGEPTAQDPSEGIGRRVAAHRAERGMRVSDLARAIGASSSLVSQIERGRSRPSVSTLFAIAEALAVPVDSFFREASIPTPPPAAAATHETAAAVHGPDSRYVVRRAERAVIEIESGVRWERLTPHSLHEVEFLELVYEPGAESHPTLYRHAGHEMMLVLSGEFDIYTGFDRVRLKAGDSMHFPSMVPHRYVNPTGKQARAVTTILHEQP